MAHSTASNVVRMPRAVPVRVRQTELPLGPNLAPIICILREIEVLSMDSLVTQGPVHPDFRLIGLCAEALQQARRIQGIHITRLERANSGKPWTDGELADDRAILETQRALRRQVVAMVNRASKIGARSPASIYAKALLLTTAPLATGLGQSLAEDLIACEGLRQSLTWPEVRS